MKIKQQIKQHMGMRKLSKILLGFLTMGILVVPSIQGMAIGTGETGSFNNSSLTEHRGSLPNNAAYYNSMDGGKAWTIAEDIDDVYKKRQITTNKEKIEAVKDGSMSAIWYPQGSFVGVLDFAGREYEADTSGGNLVKTGLAKANEDGILGRSYTIKDAEGVPIKIQDALGNLVDNPDCGYHTYESMRYDTVDLMGWRCDWQPSFCSHSTNFGDNEGTIWHGYTRTSGPRCRGCYFSGWQPICADCGVQLTHGFHYLSKSSVKQISRIDLQTGYYYFCPNSNCNGFEQGVDYGIHNCVEVSPNQYIVRFDNNATDVEGYIPDQYLRYRNMMEYEGSEIKDGDPNNVRLTSVITTINGKNHHAIRRPGYVFKGWNTKPDGTGTAIPDRYRVPVDSSQNLLGEVCKKQNGVITLYAQWESLKVTLMIETNGGTYAGKTNPTYDLSYAQTVELDASKINPPAGYKVSFVDSESTSTVMASPMNTPVEFRGFGVASDDPGSFEGVLKTASSGFSATYTAYGNNNAQDYISTTYSGGEIELPPPSNAKKGSRYFCGWSTTTSSDNIVGTTGNTYRPTANTTLYAIWGTISLTAKPNYTANGGKGAIDLSWKWDNSIYSDHFYVSYISEANKSDARAHQIQQQDGNVGLGVAANSDKTFSAGAISLSGSENVSPYTIPTDGMYEFVLEGANGGTYTDYSSGTAKTYSGGKGGKVVFRNWFAAGTKITFMVGQKGSDNNSNNPDGWVGGNATLNGAGGKYGAAGGGCTAVYATSPGGSPYNGTLLAVAGGGGGGGNKNAGGDGGSSVLETGYSNGYKGQTGHNTSYEGGGGGAGFNGGVAGKSKIVYHTHSVEKCGRHFHTVAVGDGHGGLVYLGLDKISSLVSLYGLDNLNSSVPRIYELDTSTAALVGDAANSCYSHREAGWITIGTMRWVWGNCFSVSDYTACDVCGYDTADHANGALNVEGPGHFTAVLNSGSVSNDVKARFPDLAADSRCKEELLKYDKCSDPFRLDINDGYDNYHHLHDYEEDSNEAKSLNRYWWDRTSSDTSVYYKLPDPVYCSICGELEPAWGRVTAWNHNGKPAGLLKRWATKYWELEMNRNTAEGCPYVAQLEVNPSGWLCMKRAGIDIDTNEVTASGGGSSFEFTGIGTITMGGNAHSGNGYLQIKSVGGMNGSTDKNECLNVPAPDLAAPDGLDKHLASAKKVDDTIEVAFTGVKDNGTTYKNVVDAKTKAGGTLSATTNETTTTITVGTTGFYWLIDETESTKVTGSNKKGSITTTPATATAHKTVILSGSDVASEVNKLKNGTVMWLHLNAYDKNGNCDASKSISVKIDPDEGMGISTQQITISSKISPTGTDYKNIVSKGSKTYVVRADGVSPIRLDFSAKSDRISVATKQIDEMSFNLSSGTAKEKFKTIIPYSVPATNTAAIDISQLQLSLTGTALLNDGVSAGANRVDNGNTTNLHRAFLVPYSSNGKNIFVYPSASVTQMDGVVSKDDDDRTHGITIIPDGDAPNIIGTDILPDLEIVEASDTLPIINISAVDVGDAGMGTLEVRIRDLESGGTQTKTSNGSNIAINLNQGGTFRGSVEIRITATDAVGNTRTVTYAITAFDLDLIAYNVKDYVSTEFMHDEEGRVQVTGYGRVEKMEIYVPTELQSCIDGPTVFTYAPAQREPSVTETLPFTIDATVLPEIHSGQPPVTYTFRAKAYKGAKSVEKTCTITVNDGSALDDMHVTIQ